MAYLATLSIKTECIECGDEFSYERTALAGERLGSKRRKICDDCVGLQGLLRRGMVDKKPVQPRKARETGHKVETRTQVCPVCGESFSYPYGKGMGRPRLRCDECRSEPKINPSTAGPREIVCPACFKKETYEYPGYGRTRVLCESCSRRGGNLQANYGISIYEYWEMHREQNGLCYICGLPETAGSNQKDGTRFLSVDHCHATGRVRKLLCNNCNHALGALLEDPTRIESLLRYAVRCGLLKERTFAAGMPSNGRSEGAEQ